MAKIKEYKLLRSMSFESRLDFIVDTMYDNGLYLIHDGKKIKKKSVAKTLLIASDLGVLNGTLRDLKKLGEI